ncbi:MAG TPA: hypothetical protein VK459_12565 [Polyangiaceae bacterium]|jgi:hypothetical protein|nr:hypothetical protein [Polyangiaceae bacterium]
MAQTSNSPKSQPHVHSGDQDGGLQGSEEGGNETMNEVLEDGALRGIRDDDQNAPVTDHSSKGTGREGGGEHEARQRGLEAGGGVPLNTSLEDGQLRGVDEDGQVIQGTHGGPQKKTDEATTRRKD